MAFGTRHRVQGYSAKVLQMLRAGDCTGEQIKARYGLHKKPLDRLEEEGFLTRTVSPQKTAYAITEAGRAACPPRNPATALRTLAAPKQGDGVHGPSRSRQGARRAGQESLY